MLNASEFRHGPLEVVEEGVPYVFMLGNDESRHTVERVIRFVKSLQRMLLYLILKIITVDYIQC